jgi:hypothetical protein
MNEQEGDRELETQHLGVNFSLALVFYFSEDAKF